ncbi:MAG TPA: SAM-dependent chlorinase/fluorinase [Gaiellaceae bacterium]|nr:SAM-dependent chlorinase/fluorinase [Gaiellaceae bacterium]
MFITFLSDFGLRDDFVGTCHGVMKRIAPEVDIIDITHGIEPQAVLQGALVLGNTIPYMPVGVHLAVIDPGVGTDRRGLVVCDAEGRLYVGPDNGLLVPAAEKGGGITGAWELTNRAYMLQPVSHTFHGRDVFSPAAAHLARGVEPDEFGDAIASDALVRLELPVPEVGEASIRATVLYIDRFGNVQLNLSRSDVERADIGPGRRIELELGFERYYARAARTFAEARAGDIILYEDAYENIALAITDGNAAEMFTVKPGEQILLRVLS